MHRLGACNFTLSIECALNAIAGDLIRDFKQLRFDVQQRHLPFGLANLCRQLLLCANHLARVSVSEFQRFQEFRFRQFVGGTFDHDDIVFGADINQIEIAL